MTDKKQDEGLQLISLRINQEMIDEIEKMIKRVDRHLKTNGNKNKSETTFSDVLRMCLGRGIQVLRQEIDDTKQTEKGHDK